ncbi:TPR-REGION domain-containing protein [Mycena sanguinolenta]|uniref:TPR-REGION domain-containing protein n=1 Tax=Mycena sanguinolenta TaxID=230812 RepID=A0A8H6XAD2_9AGAR|nr:TPR-REGION domain-containing protein [Mycena sanguinolenta]
MAENALASSQPMSEITYVDVQMISDIRKTTKEAHERGLLTATKWALDLLRAVSQERRSSSAQKSPKDTPPSTEEEIREEEVFELARKSVDEKQHARAEHLLRNCHSDKAVFLRTYCRYISSEKKALRAWHTAYGDRHQPPTPVNPLLTELYQSVEAVAEPWLLFLKALFLFRLARYDEAIDCVLLSIAALPWNWSAWQLLGDCIHDPKSLSTHLQKITLPPSHPLVQIFMVRMMNELYSTTQTELEICDTLLGPSFFPQSLFLMSLRANVLYNLHRYAQAEQQFDSILAIDPYRIDDLDTLANILYAVENKEKLSALAQFFLVLNKDRPEGATIHCGRSTKNPSSIFRRAIELDRTCSAAWTLMGIEYLEMTNLQAAVDSFRRAIDVNPKDYRAWSGLGKSYGIMGMHSYALHYHSRSLRLRPEEAECWEDLAHAFEASGRLEDAIVCFKRALDADAPHPMTVFLRLAHLLSQTNDQAGAVSYAQAAVAQGEAHAQPVEYYAKALVAVAEYQIRLPGGDWTRAREYLERVVDSPSPPPDDPTHSKAVELLKYVKTKIADARRVRPGLIS